MPLQVTNDTWTDVRLRSFAQDGQAIGDAGAFWMFYYPKRVHLHNLVRCIPASMCVRCVFVHRKRV